MGKKPKLATIIGASLAPFTGGLSLAAAAPEALDALTPDVPKAEAPPDGTDEDAAQAKERERLRLSSGGRPTVLSGGRKAALSANIGKRTLGGTS